MFLSKRLVFTLFFISIFSALVSKGEANSLPIGENQNCKFSLDNNLNIPEDSIIATLPDFEELAQKLNNDLIKFDNKLEGLLPKIELYAKTSSKDELIIAERYNWPDDTEISYNVLRNSDNQIIYLAILPISESGDWYMSYEYHFDENGNCSVFKRVSNFFNSECVKGVIFETSTYFFNEEFKLIKKSYTLKDENKKDVSRELCAFPYRYEYKIHDNIDKLGLSF